MSFENQNHLIKFESDDDSKDSNKSISNIDEINFNNLSNNKVYLDKLASPDLDYDNTQYKSYCNPSAKNSSQTNIRFASRKLSSSKPKNLKRKFCSTSSIYLNTTVNLPDPELLIDSIAGIIVSQILEDELSGKVISNKSELYYFSEDKYITEYPLNFNDSRKENLDLIPTQEDVSEFIKALYYCAQFSVECCVLALIYINRIIAFTGLSLNPKNWRPLVLVSLMTAQKVWDDLYLCNADFAYIYPFFDVDQLGILEMKFLEMIQYNVFVKFSLYLKYYLELRSLFPLDKLRDQYSEDYQNLVRLRSNSEFNFDENEKNKEDINLYNDNDNPCSVIKILSMENEASIIRDPNISPAKQSTKEVKDTDKKNPSKAKQLKKNITKKLISKLTLKQLSVNNTEDNETKIPTQSTSRDKTNFLLSKNNLGFMNDFLPADSMMSTNFEEFYKIHFKKNRSKTANKSYMSGEGSYYIIS